MHTSKKTVYVETTIPSYATAKPSMDILSANRQAITKLFWEYEKDKCSHLGVETYAKIYEYNNKKGIWIPELVTPEMLIQYERDKQNELQP